MQRLNKGVGDGEEGWQGGEKRQRTLVKRKSEWDRGEVNADEISRGMYRINVGLHIWKNNKIVLLVAAMSILQETAFSHGFTQFHEQENKLLSCKNSYPTQIRCHDICA